MGVSEYNNMVQIPCAERDSGGEERVKTENSLCNFEVWHLSQRPGYPANPL
jgi:hypothetical protein